MLSTTLAMNSAEVAIQLKELNIQIQPADNSLLSELVDASVPCNLVPKGEIQTTILPGGRVQASNFSTWNLTEKEDFANAVALATGNHSETSAHTLRITAIADDLAPIVTSHIYNIRNNVIPLVQKFEEDAQRYMDLAKTVSPASDFSIKIARIPLILADESFNAMGLDDIVNLNETQEAVKRFTLKIEDIDAAVAEIKNLGSDRLNGLLNDWLLDAEEDLIRNVLVTNFTADATKWNEFGFDAYTLRRGDQYRAMELSLAMFVVSLWLKSSAKPMVENATLEQYNTMVQYYQDVSGVVLKASLDAMGRQIQSNTLVLLASPSQKKVTVHDVVYKSFMEKGGKPAALLGMLVSDKSLFDASVILEQQDKLIESWNNYLVFRAAKDSSDIRSGFQSWVRSYMAVAVTEQIDLEKEYEKEVPALKEVIMQRVDAEIEHLSHRLSEDLAHTALHMVAKARFFYTPAYDFLNEMIQVAKVNKDIDPREAASAAQIAYLVQYLYTQMNITTILK